MPLSVAGFDLSDVQSAADTDPWQRRDDFAEEVNEDDMADDAVAYAKAAEEADTATELGEAASRQGGESAQYDGQDLIDRANQDALTSSDLGNGGADMERVVSNIMTAIGLASETVETVNAVIDGGGEEVGLNTLIEQISQHAEDVHELFVEGLEEYPKDVEQPPVLEYNGDEYNATGSPGSWYVPGVLVSAIRESHIEVAAQQAGVADRNISQAIEGYRHRLSGIAVDLDEDGYDPTNSRLNYWRTEEMAEYNGAKLDEELREEEPDPDKLAQYSLGLEGALNDIYDPEGNIREDFDPDSSGSGAYVSAFMSELSAESFRALEALDGEVPDSGVPIPREGSTAAEQVAAVQRAVSNGVIASLDPAAGGADPQDVIFDEDGNVPDSARNTYLEEVAEYVYHLPDTLAETSGTDMQTLMDRYERFGNLLGHSTVTPGYDFGQDLADSAVEVQRVITDNNDLADGTDGAFVTTENTPIRVENNVGGDLLSIAARNEQAAADQIAERSGEDDRFMETLLFSGWQDDRGAAEFVHSGTVVPDDMDPLAPEAKSFVEAAYHVLSTAGDGASTHPDRGIPNDNNVLVGAVGDTMIEYMDLIARDANPSSEFVDNGSSPSEIFGREHRYDFNLSTDERNGLFEMMLGTDEIVADNFNSHVAEWQYQKADDAFNDSHDARPGDSISAAARISGYMDSALISLDAEGRIDPETARTSAVTAVSAIGVPYKTAAKLIFTGVAEGARHVMPEFEFLGPDFHLESHLDRNGTMAVRHIVAQAAIDNDVDGMGGEELPPLIDLDGVEGLGSTLDDADQALDRLEGDYDYLPETSNSLNENYQRGRSPEAPVDYRY